MIKPVPGTRCSIQMSHVHESMCMRIPITVVMNWIYNASQPQFLAKSPHEYEARENNSHHLQAPRVDPMP